MFYPQKVRKTLKEGIKTQRVKSFSAFLILTQMGKGRPRMTRDVAVNSSIHLVNRMTWNVEINFSK